MPSNLDNVDSAALKITQWHFEHYLDKVPVKK